MNSSSSCSCQQIVPKVLPHPVYSSDFASSDYYLFHFITLFLLTPTVIRFETKPVKLLLYSCSISPSSSPSSYISSHIGLYWYSVFGIQFSSIIFRCYSAILVYSVMIFLMFWFLTETNLLVSFQEIIFHHSNSISFCVKETNGIYFNE